jgi:16S rRNA (adenine1518-N6/adenine1519-N6)-dimethyltransferase
MVADHSMRQVGSHRPRKRFGQNFLVDGNVIDNIVDAIAAKPDDNLIEIGPGKGALTKPLLKQNPNLTVIELDRDLVANLYKLHGQYPHLRVVEGDALKTDFSQFSKAGKLRIVGNLPYNISTPLLFHLLQFRHLIHDMHFMLQKEVVERLGAAANNKNYGRLSIMVQYCAQVEALFDVPPESFAPAPKVDSAIVRIRPFQQLPYPAQNESLLANLVTTCFQFRRKTLRNSLRKFRGDDIIAALPIDTNLRPENLSVQDFVSLANTLDQ